MTSIHPTKIKLNPDQSRYRKEMGDIQGLALSIQKHGQLQPIVVTEDMELVAGGRRLAACTMLNQDVKYEIFSNLSPLEKRAIEIEENVARKAFTPAEEVLAIDELHQLRTAQAAERKETWTLNDTARELGVSKMNISRDLKAAEAVKANPNLKGATTKKELVTSEKGQKKLIAKALKMLERKEAAGNIVRRAEEFVHHTDGLAFLDKMDDGSIDVLLTDPPYGIEVDKQTRGLGEGFKFTDTRSEAEILYGQLAALSYQKTAPDAHAIVFGSVEMFELSKDLFEGVGWKVWPRPIVWVKNTTGQANNPDKWPASCFEVAMFARKEESQLHKYPMCDWVQFPPVVGDKKSHPTEKPLGLFQYILSHVGFEGGVMFDPFAGSFASVHAAFTHGMIGIGCDINPAAHLVGLERLSAYFEEEGNGPVS